MPRLTETRAGFLAAASDRPDRNLLPLPGPQGGGGAAKVVVGGRGRTRRLPPP